MTPPFFLATSERIETTYGDLQDTRILQYISNKNFSQLLAGIYSLPTAGKDIVTSYDYCQLQRRSGEMQEDHGASEIQKTGVREPSKCKMEKKSKTTKGDRIN